MTLRFYKLKILIVCLFLSSCSNFEKEFGTMIIHGGTIYTVDSTQTTVEAVVTKNEIKFSLLEVLRKPKAIKMNKRNL